jgi:hypothetical protein
MTTLGTVISKKQGHDIPDDFLALVIKNCSTGIGMAMAMDDTKELLWSRDFGAPDLKDFSSALKAYKDKELCLYAFESDDEFADDGFSPFAICPKDDKPEIVAFVDGEFPDWEQDEGTTPYYPSAYHYVKNNLQPKITQIYNLCKGDLDATFEAINTPLMAEEILNVESGTVLILTGKGRALSLSVGNDREMDYTWGEVSDCFGFLANKPAETSGRVSLKDLAAPKTYTALGTVQASITGRSTDAPIEPAKVIWGKPPADIIGKHARMRWYLKFSGVVPKDVNKKDPPLVMIKPEYWSLEGTGFLMAKDEPVLKGMEALAAHPAAAAAQPNADKDTAPKHIAPTDPIKPSGPVTNIASSMDAATKEKFTKQFMKRKVVTEAEARLLDQSGKVIKDPTELFQEVETRLPRYSEQTGRPLELVFGYGIDEFADLERNYPRALTALCLELRNALYNSYKEKREKSKSDQSTETAGTAVQGGLAARRIAAGRVKLTQRA